MNLKYQQRFITRVIYLSAIYYNAIYLNVTYLNVIYLKFNFEHLYLSLTTFMG
ncbi:MAG: hypothetical protein ACI9UT_002151 [Flavobacteriales bacterium]